MRNSYAVIGVGLGDVEQVGSAGEKQIARMLAHYGVRFFYEHPIAVINRGRVRIWYCDFWLPDYGVAIEYDGITGDRDYAAGVEHKKGVYGYSGIACVHVSASDLTGNWPGRITNQIRDVLSERLTSFDALERCYRRERGW